MRSHRDAPSSSSAEHEAGSAEGARAPLAVQLKQLDFAAGDAMLTPRKVQRQQAGVATPMQAPVRSRPTPIGGDNVPIPNAPDPMIVVMQALAQFDRQASSAQGRMMALSPAARRVAAAAMAELRERVRQQAMV